MKSKQTAIDNFKFYIGECLERISADKIDHASYWSLCSHMNHLINSAQEVMRVMGKYKRNESEELEVAHHLVERLEQNEAVTAFGISLDEGREAIFKGPVEERKRLAREIMPGRVTLD
jgi:hypothetical protein|nr:MAG TPA: hypothetical protein [Caudoviricetes sp.]